MIKLKDLIVENMDSSKLRISSSPQAVSVMYITGPGRSSVASIDNIEGNDWWVSRVLVGDKQLRGQGIGSIILQKAVQEVLKQDSNASIVVAPGGYGENSEKQFKFYKKNGFIEMPDQPSALVYKKE